MSTEPALYRAEAMSKALLEVGTLLSEPASRRVVLTAGPVIPLNEQRDLDSIVPTVTRIGASVRMAFDGAYRGATHVLFTERMAQFLQETLASRWSGHASRLVEMDVMLEAGQCLISAYWEAWMAGGLESEKFHFEQPVLQWGPAEGQLEMALKQEEASACVIACEADECYVNEWILVQAGTKSRGDGSRGGAGS